MSTRSKRWYWNKMCTVDCRMKGISRSITRDLRNPKIDMSGKTLVYQDANLGLDELNMLVDRVEGVKDIQVADSNIIVVPDYEVFEGDE